MLLKHNPKKVMVIYLKGNLRLFFLLAEEKCLLGVQRVENRVQRYSRYFGSDIAHPKQLVLIFVWGQTMLLSSLCK